MAEGKRVIFTGLCRGEISPENISIIGMIVISDKVRKNAREIIGYFYSQGIDVKIISGCSLGDSGKRGISALHELSPPSICTIAYVKYTVNITVYFYLL